MMNPSTGRKEILDFDATIYARSLLNTAQNRDCEIENNEPSLRGHWISQGLDRNILASSIDSRASFLELIDTRHSSLLEVGPFYSPVFTGGNGNVKYADLLSTDQLKERARSLGAAPEGVPSIDFICKEGRVDTQGLRFDVVFSSHNVEHQPNLLGHLLNTIDILLDRGRYFFIVPDHRYCFDCYMTPSSLAEVLAAFYEERQKPSLKSVFEHRLFTIDYSALPRTNPFEQLVGHAFHGLHAAIHEFNTHDYVDVHCWYFTPKSLKVMLENCIHLGILPGHLKISVFPLGPEIGCVIEKNKGQ